MYKLEPLKAFVFGIIMVKNPLVRLGMSRWFQYGVFFNDLNTDSKLTSEGLEVIHQNIRGGGF